MLTPHCIVLCPHKVCVLTCFPAGRCYTTLRWESLTSIALYGNRRKVKQWRRPPFGMRICTTYLNSPTCAVGERRQEQSYHLAIKSKGCFCTPLLILKGCTCRYSKNFDLVTLRWLRMKWGVTTSGRREGLADFWARGRRRLGVRGRWSRRFWP